MRVQKTIVAPEKGLELQIGGGGGGVAGTNVQSMRMSCSACHLNNKCPRNS